MRNKYNWTNYNLKRNKEAIKINNFNKKNKINYLEKGLYKNVRDIYALALIIARSNNKNTEILDYGGNLISSVNLVNKINTKKIKISIFNPFQSKNFKNNTSLKIKIYEKINEVRKKKFNLTYLGSVLQYINDIKKISGKSIILKSNYILITHTPISLSKSKFLEKQTNARNLFQKVHSYKNIYHDFLEKKYSLIFRSINEFKYSGLKKNNKNVFLLNLLFKKNNK